MQNPEPVRRTSEIEDFSNLYFIHAIADRATKLLARLHVRPNAVSLAGMLFGILAGFAYYRTPDPRFVVAGFVLMIAWHVMDGVDGQLARLTRSQSELGRVLDGICDYVTFIAVYAGLALRLGRDHGGWVWAVVIAAGACHAVQSAAYEAQRQDYDFCGWGRRAGGGSADRHLSGRLHRAYARVQVLATGFSDDHQRRLGEILARQPERAADIRGRYRRAFAAPVRRWSVLSANSRTFGIFLCALLGVPLLYFWFEIFGFSLILAVLARRQQARYARFLAGLATDASSGTG